MNTRDGARLQAERRVAADNADQCRKNDKAQIVLIGDATSDAKHGGTIAATVLILDKIGTGINAAKSLIFNRNKVNKTSRFGIQKSGLSARGTGIDSSPK
jgi:hypothetical protein